MALGFTTTLALLVVRILLHDGATGVAEGGSRGVRSIYPTTRSGVYPIERPRVRKPGVYAWIKKSIGEVKNQSVMVLTEFDEEVVPSPMRDLYECHRARG